MARNPVTASSKTCSANATVNANQGWPKEVLRDGSVSMGYAPCGPFSISATQTANVRDRISGLGLLHFTHQSHQIPLRVAEEYHPQIVIGHSCDQVRLIFEGHTLLFHRGVGGLNVRHREVENGAGVIELRFLGPGQHE